ncbi:MAG: phosphoribosylpyrophosphate synthetase, partial [Deltaproteobacteria bacterium]|nr:phosphoribosylpyrophosphate synthetase [Deltaproteobacteria bacterium]
AALVKAGAKEVFAYATHAVFSNDAVSLIEASPLKEVVVTDTIKLNSYLEKCSKIRAVSCSSLIGEAIRRVHTSSSISSLFL